MYKKIIKAIKVSFMFFIILVFSLGFPHDVQAEETTGSNQGIMESPEISLKPIIELSDTLLTYTGRSIKPTVTVTDKNGIRLDASEYQVTYPASSVNVGHYRLTVTIAEGAYKGTYTKKYKINPAMPEIRNITPIVKGFRITWKKNTAFTTAYQVAYAKKFDFSDMKKRRYSGKSRSVGMVRELKSHATYYVKLRRIYKTETETFYSPWTEASKVCTRTYLDNYKAIKGMESTASFQYINTEKKLSKTRKKALDQAVTAITGKGYKLSFVLLDLDTGEGIARNITQVFNAASTIKGPYVCAITSQMPDKVRKYRSSVTKTIVNSDNYCYTSLRNTFGHEPMRVYMKEAHTSIPLKTWTRYSSRKLSLLWLRNWEFFESGTKDAVWTKNTFDHSYMSYINEQMSDGKTKVYSKPGWLYTNRPKAQHDAGIVVKENGHRYMLTILSTAYQQKPLLRKLVKELDKCEEYLLRQ